jgi:hypothetical protein
MRVVQNIRSVARVTPNVSNLGGGGMQCTWIAYHLIGSPKSLGPVHGPAIALHCPQLQYDHDSYGHVSTWFCTAPDLM